MPGPQVRLVVVLERRGRAGAVDDRLVAAGRLRRLTSESELAVGKRDAAGAARTGPSAENDVEFH